MLDRLQSENGQLPETYSWLEGGQRYVVCAFYTDNYLPRALALLESLKTHGINCYLKRYDHQGSWEATTRLKPGFIAHCLEQFPKLDVVYVDADAVVRKPLAFMDQIRTDVGLWLHPRRRRGRWYLRITASVVYVRNSEAGRRFVRSWADPKIDCGRLAVDEDLLQAAFSEYEGLTLTVLPAGYVKIFDEARSDPVIEHFQASRGEFNWRRAMRKTRQAATVAAAVAGAIALLWYLLR